MAAKEQQPRRGREGVAAKAWQSRAGSAGVTL